MTHTSFWAINCSLVTLLCIFCTGIVIPQILLIAFRRRLFDIPDERKVHRNIVPRLGGIAFKPVIFLSMGLLVGANLALGHQKILIEIWNNALPLSFGFCSVMILHFVGMTDDLVGIRYHVKFIIQILCGGFLIAGGIYINDLHGFLGFHTIPIWFAYPLTILITVFIINAINLIDGIDGLASGLCCIACLFYGFSFFMLHEYIYAMLSFATLGVLVPFFYYNVFGNARRGRKIFMGDTGSLTIGMILCFLSIRLALCAPGESPEVPNPMVLAFSPLLVPGLDVVRVYFHRVRSRKNPFLPDKNHIHHKLLAVNMHQQRVMITIISTSIVFSLFNILLSQYLNVNWILFSNIFIWTSANIWLTNRIKNINRFQKNN